MPNGILSDIEFENQIDKLGDNQLALIKFVARQQFASSKLLITHNDRIISIETGNRKSSSIIGGISGTITAIIIGIINYFTINRS